MSRVRFEPSGREIEVEPGRTLLDAAREALVGLPAVCAGRGSCGKCQVRFLEGPLPPPGGRDRAALGERQLAQGWRLACEHVVTEDLVLQSIAVRHQGKGESPPLESGFHPDPPLHRRQVELIPPSLEKPVDDAGNLCRGLAAGLAEGGLAARAEAVESLDLELLASLPEILRAADWRLEASVRGAELVGLRPLAGAGPSLGCALDLGTTNLALQVYDLQEGRLLAAYGAANPLTSYGADIVSRLGYGEASQERRRELQSILVGAVNLLLGQAKAELGLSAQDIEEMAVVGNSGMHHLFLGLSGRQLIRAPYVPVSVAPVTVKARELGLDMARGGYVYLPPLVGGFVGSDLLAVALFARMDTRRGIRIAVDIGTNTEVLLSVDGELHCCSTASGPALEGAALQFGTVASPGAIDRMWSSQGALGFSTIGQAAAVGICGSGIVDALRSLRELGIVSQRGRIGCESPLVHSDPGGDHCCILAPEGATALGSDLTISQMEIRSVQLAKGAIRAGIDSLLAIHGLGPESVDEFLIAGSFGNHLDVGSAVAIGLFPPLPQESFRQIGNAAGTGAGLMLLSKGERLRAERMAASIGHVELSLQEGFRLSFARSQWFPEERA